MYSANGPGNMRPGQRLQEIILIRETNSDLPPPITSARDVIALMAPWVEGEWREKLFVIPMNGRNQPYGVFLCSIGTTDQSLVAPVSVLLPCVQLAATNLILVHNHPSGSPEPSLEDRTITTRLKDCADLMGMELIDHVVIGRKFSYSFSTHSYIENGGSPCL